MDLKYYFNAVDFSKLNLRGITENKNSLGNLLQKNMLRFSAESLQKFKVAIIGIPYDEKTPNKGSAKAPDEVRKQLYSLDNIDPKFKIVDLGNLKCGKGEKAVYYALRDIIDYLSEYGLTTIVIGGGQDLSVGVARAFKHDNFFQFSSVDQTISMNTTPSPYSATNYISRILKENPQIFHVNFIGFQRYFVAQNTLSKVRQLLFDTFRLGTLREDITKIEPTLRDSAFLSFNMGAVRQSDSPGYFDCSPQRII